MSSAPTTAPFPPRASLENPSSPWCSRARFWRNTAETRSTSFEPTMKHRGGANIFLIGPMGSGKSTVGRALSKLLGCEFIDTDRRIERKAGMLIRDIFARSGEPAFRKLERREIARAARGRGCVIAVGGG